MIPIISLLVIVFLSLLVTRVASVALIHTGLGRESARFQAASAFTGVGFTTSEAEQIVGHPVRRRVVRILMLLGNAGIVTAMASLLLTFVGPQEGHGLVAFALLASGILVLWWLGSSAWVDVRMSRLISYALRRWTAIDARDYARLLHLREDYGVTELHVRSGDWIADRELGDAGLSEEGVLCLGIECPGGEFIGAPGPETEIRNGDSLILYGRIPRIAEVDRRARGGQGDHAHAMAVSEHEGIQAREKAAAGR
jgi:hypothetical protein